MNGADPGLAELLDRIAAFAQRFVRFSSAEQVDTLALWIVHTHCIEAFETTPYLFVTSAEKRSGKSRLFEVLELLVARPWKAAEPSDASIFRSIDNDRPTLLIDEMDSTFSKDPKQYQTLRGILNAGYRRGTPVRRVEPEGKGKAFTVKAFDVFGAKAFAGLGALPDTILDRSIRVELIRRSPTDEPVERFRLRLIRAEAEPIRAELEAWAASAEEALKDAFPSLPDELGDRSQDVWEPLLSIADAAGPEWGKRARRAAIMLSGMANYEDASIGIQLLGDIRDIFEREQVDKIATSDLLVYLVEVETSPWGAWWGKDVEQAQAQRTPKGPASKLARLLKPYSIKPRDIRVGDRGGIKGYLADDFKDEWNRFLPPASRSDDETLQRDTADQSPEGGSKTRTEEDTKPPLNRPVAVSHLETHRNGDAPNLTFSLGGEEVTPDRVREEARKFRFPLCRVGMGKTVEGEASWLAFIAECERKRDSETLRQAFSLLW